MQERRTFSVMFTCKLDILAKWTVFMITRTYQRLKLMKSNVTMPVMMLECTDVDVKI